MRYLDYPQIYLNPKKTSKALQDDFLSLLLSNQNSILERGMVLSKQKRKGITYQVRYNEWLRTSFTVSRPSFSIPWKSEGEKKLETTSFNFIGALNMKILKKKLLLKKISSLSSSSSSSFFHHNHYHNHDHHDHNNHHTFLAPRCQPC